MSQASVRRRVTRRVLTSLSALVIACAALGAPAMAADAATERYVVVFGGGYALDGSYALGGDYALNHAYALEIVRAAGGTVTSDLSR